MFSWSAAQCSMNISRGMSAACRRKLQCQSSKFRVGAFTRAERRMLQQNIISLGGGALLVSIIGADGAGLQLRQELSARAVAPMT